MNRKNRFLLEILRCFCFCTQIEKFKEKVEKVQFTRILPKDLLSILSSLLYLSQIAIRADQSISFIVLLFYSQ